MAEGKSREALGVLSGLSPKARDDVRAVRLRGRAFFAAGELASAERFLRLALGLNPNDAEALWTLGQLQERRDDAHAAKKAYALAVKANGYRVRLRLDYGHLLARCGDNAEAERQFSAILARHMKDPIALAGRARVRVELGRKGAYGDLQTLRETGQRDTARLLGLRKAMLAEKWKGAAEALAMLKDRSLMASAQVQLWRAEIAMHVGPRVEAEGVYRALIAQLTPTQDRAVAAAAHLGLSRLFLEKRKTADALV
ncbi:MAG: tetratricopeptide repeat protein, partial [Deltaproteobacteria bacterium]|nr:tetratricopeptide repeat protein [Deltaproteobacteria bacterium]